MEIDSRVRLAISGLVGAARIRSAVKRKAAPAATRTPDQVRAERDAVREQLRRIIDGGGRPAPALLRRSSDLTAEFNALQSGSAPAPTGAGTPAPPPGAPAQTTPQEQVYQQQLERFEKATRSALLNPTWRSQMQAFLGEDAFNSMFKQDANGSWSFASPDVSTGLYERYGKETGGVQGMLAGGEKKLETARVQGQAEKYREQAARAATTPFFYQSGGQVRYYDPNNIHGTQLGEGVRTKYFQQFGNPGKQRELAGQYFGGEPGTDYMAAGQWGDREGNLRPEIRQGLMKWDETWYPAGGASAEAPAAAPAPAAPAATATAPAAPVPAAAQTPPVSAQTPPAMVGADRGGSGPSDATTPVPASPPAAAAPPAPVSPFRDRIAGAATPGSLFDGSGMAKRFEAQRTRMQGVNDARVKAGKAWQAGLAPRQAPAAAAGGWWGEGSKISSAIQDRDDSIHRRAADREGAASMAGLDTLRPDRTRRSASQLRSYFSP